MPCGAEDGVDSVAFGGRQVVQFEEVAGLEIVDNGFDGATPARLAADGWGFDATGLADGDVETLALDFMARVASIHIGALHVDAG